MLHSFHGLSMYIKVNFIRSVIVYQSSESVKFSDSQIIDRKIMPHFKDL